MSTLWRLIRLYRPYGGWIALSILVAFAATLANVSLMAISGWFITVMAVAGATATDVNYFAPAAAIRGIAIVRTGGRYVERLIGHEATLRLVAETRAALFAGMVPLAPAALDDLRSGDLLARLKTDIDRIELVFLRLVVPTVVATGILAAAGAVLWVFDPGLAVAVVAALALGGGLVPALAAIGGADSARAATGHAAALRRVLVDDLRALGPLIAAGAVPRRRAALTARFDDLLKEEGRTARRVALGRAASGLSGEAAMLAALVLGIPLVRAGALDGPELTLAALLALAAADATMGLAAAFAALPATLASAARIFAILDRVPVVSDPPDSAMPPEGNDLRFENVGLTYPGGDRPALDGVDLTIPEGTRVALVGPSGAGKSSLIELLVRFRDPDSGVIRIGGAALTGLRLDDVRGRFAVAPQTPHLFNDTLAANLRIAAPRATDAELAEALRAVGLDTLPGGLDTPVGNGGTRLSGGEARRLAVARALIANAPVLILDEPGEGLDAGTEARVLDAVFARAAGRTVILSTHAPAALERVDLVVSMDGGRIVATRWANDAARFHSDPGIAM
jgi:ATP-binding cassette, subfamily C, bacterial CydC